jgi:hypothetical protein
MCDHMGTSATLPVSTAQLLVAECDRSERFVTVSHSYAARFRLTPEQIVGRTVCDLLGARVHQSSSPTSTTSSRGMK